MLSRNNWKEQVRQQEPKKQRFTIKKLTIGVASVLIGFTFMGMSASANGQTISTTGTPAGTNQNASPSMEEQSNNNANPSVQPAQSGTGSKAITADSGQPNNAQNKQSNNNANPSVQPAQSGTGSKAITADSGQPNNAQNKQSNVDLSLWKWQTADSTKGYNGIKLTGYTGAVDENATIYVPNNVDFIKAGKIKAGQSVYLGDLSYIKNCRRLIIDNHDGGKVIFVRNPTGSIPTFTSETLEYIDVSGADTHLLTDMSYMFSYSPNLKRIVGLENFDTSHVQSFEMMFGFDPQLMDIDDLSNWDVSQAKSFEMMFIGTKKLESIGSLKDWQVKNVTDMPGMFLLSSIVGVDMSNWDVSSLRDVSYMFAYNYNPRFTNLELPNFSKAKLKSWLQAFLDDNYLENINISGWDFVDDLNNNKGFHDTSYGADNFFDKWLSTSGVNGLTVNTIGAKWPSDLDLMPENSDFDYNPKYGVTDDNGISSSVSFEGLEEYIKDIKYSEKPTPLVVLTDNQTLLGYNRQRSESNRPNEITLVDKNGKVVGQYQMPIFYTSIDSIKKQIGQYENEYTQNYCKQNNDPKATFTFTLVDPETHQELTEEQIENLTPAQLVMTTYLVRQNAKATVTYIDQTTGKTLTVKTLKGYTLEDTGYNTASDIKNYVDNGYDLVSDTSNGAKIIFDDDDAADQAYTVTLKHGTITVTPKDDLNKTVKRTINITTPDGKTQTITQKAEFTRSATVDEVTDEVISYGNWTLATGSAKDWGQFNVPQLDGFISYVDGNAAKEVAEENVTADTADVTVEVTYKNSDNNTNPGDDGNHNTNPGDDGNKGTDTPVTPSKPNTGKDDNNKGDQPTNPTTPTKPDDNKSNKPVTPTNPAKPDNGNKGTDTPVTPSKPNTGKDDNNKGDQPTNPTTPTKPDDNKSNKPVTPTNPAKPDNGNKGTDTPVTPSKPNTGKDDNNKGDQPTNPTTPTKPDDNKSNKPVTPTNPAKPDNGNKGTDTPVTPSKPNTGKDDNNKGDQPTNPTTPTKPDDNKSNKPVTPTNPAKPDNGNKGTDTPVTPSKPNTGKDDNNKGDQPTNPTTPTKPDDNKSNKPVTPTNPAKPDNGNKGTDTPVTPSKPNTGKDDNNKGNQPTNPTTPTKPDDNKSNKPVTPTNPAKPDNGNKGTDTPVTPSKPNTGKDDNNKGDQPTNPTTPTKPDDNKSNKPVTPTNPAKPDNGNKGTDTPVTPSKPNTGKDDNNKGDQPTNPTTPTKPDDNKSNKPVTPTNPAKPDNGNKGTDTPVTPSKPTDNKGDQPTTPTIPAQPDHGNASISGQAGHKPATSDNGTQNGNGNKTVNTNVTDNGNGDNSQNNKQALPQTGNTKNDAAVAGLGLAGLLAMLGLGGLKKKRN